MRFEDLQAESEMDAMAALSDEMRDAIAERKADGEQGPLSEMDSELMAQDELMAML